MLRNIIPAAKLALWYMLGILCLAVLILAYSTNNPAIADGDNIYVLYLGGKLSLAAPAVYGV